MDDRYLELDVDSVYIANPDHDSFTIRVKLEDEGVVVDLMNNGDEVVATTWKTYSEFGVGSIAFVERDYAHCSSCDVIIDTDSDEWEVIEDNTYCPSCAYKEKR